MSAAAPSSPARAQDRREHVRHRLAVEQARAGQHLVEHDAERPDVGALVDSLALGLLGRHVRRGAEDDAELRAERAVSVGEFSGVGARRAPRAGSIALARPKSSTLTVPSGGP